MKKILLILAFSFFFIFPSHATEQHNSSMLASAFRSESDKSNTDNVQLHKENSQATKEEKGGGSSFVIITIIALGVTGFIYNKKLKLITKGFYAQPNFCCDKAFINNSLKTAIAVDERGQRLCFYKKRGKYNPSYQVIESMDIMSVELLEDDNVIAETLRTDAINGTLIGGPLLGDIIASVASISASNKVKKISLRVSVSSSYNSLCEVIISDKKLNKNKKKYRKIISDAIDWYNIASRLMQRFNDSQHYQMSELDINTNTNTYIDTATNKNSNVNISASISIADELEKLYQLKEKGILSNEEFETQKRRILN